MYTYNNFKIRIIEKHIIFFKKITQLGKFFERMTLVEKTFKK